MEFTGERYIPIESSRDEISVEHLHRYHSILPLVKDKVVLDIACGEGYGSALMAKIAKRVVGVDISKECIEHATRKYFSQCPNTRFLQGSVEKIPAENGSLDVVISFETIEHVSGDGQQQFLSEVKRVLKKDGIFIISTPDKENYTERYQHENHFHVHELNRSEFAELIAAHFTNVHFMEQGFEIVSTIIPSDYTSLDAVRLINWQDKVQPKKGKYLMAIASDQPVAGAAVASLVLETDKDYFSQIDRILELQDQVEDRTAWALRLDKEREQHEATINDLKAQIYSFRLQDIKELTAKIEAIHQWHSAEAKQKQAEIDELTAAGKQQKELIDRLTAEIEELQKRNSELQQKEAEVLSMANQLQEKDRLLQDLQFNFSLTRQQLSDVNNKLVTIYDSDGWKVLDRYYTLKGKYLNEQSRHYRLAKQTINFLRNKKEAIAIPPPPTVNRTGKSKLVVRAIPQFDNPTVSIVIPVYNAWEMNEKCIASIIEHTGDVAYEVIVADDCSTDETKDISKYFINVVHVRNEQNLGFLKNCNHAASYARGKYIHFLNNDTEVKTGWLSSLVRLMESDAAIGMTGSKLVYPDGKLQEAGGIIWNDASGWNYGNRQNPDMPEFNYVKEVDYISGASMLVRKALWEELGGFDECYTPAYCEDSDLAFAVRQKRYKVVYQPLSEVVHYEGYSHGSDSAVSEISSIKEYQKINNQKFFEKWKAVLQSEQFPNAENVFWAKDRSRGKKTLLMVDHYVPQFDKDAGSRTTLQYLELFVKLGYNVKFLGENFYRHEPYTTVLQQMGIEVLYGPWYRDNWQQWFKENSEKFDYIYLNRPHISINFIDFFKQYSTAKIIYYGHDLHFLREQKKYEVEKDSAILEESEKWKKIELYLFGKSDVILTPSTDEQVMIKKLDPQFNVQLMRPYIYPAVQPPQTNFSIRQDILFVGGFGHLPNVDGVLWFVNEVWPIIKAGIPSARFIVAGSNPPAAVKALSSNEILIRGYVADDELERLYSSCKLAVIPLRYGAGVKGKTVEAMRFGLPLITTQFGVEGLPGDYSFIHVADSSGAFAEATINLYRDERALTCCSMKSVEYISNNFSEKVAQDIIINALATA
jgi:O-antigen biosynthesis protein